MAGLFFANDTKAQIEFVESFEYNTGLLEGQGGWETPYANYSCWVDNIKVFDGLKSISVQENYSVCGGYKEIATTTTGFMSFYFYSETKDPGENILYFLGVGSWISVQNFKITIGTETLTLPGSENWNTNRWHKIGVEYNTNEEWVKAKFDDYNWTATTTISDIPINQIFFMYNNVYREEQDFFIDFIQGSASYSDYTYETMGLEELPALESCEGLGITEGFLCEIRNFFTRLFVPTPEKINELKSTMDLIKNRFPYSYILTLQDFFSYLKDNVNENQDINFSILEQAGQVNFGFWNSTTTLAGGVQSFLEIFKTFFKFLLMILFGLWFFSVIKRIFK